MKCYTCCFVCFRFIKYATLKEANSAIQKYDGFEIGCARLAIQFSNKRPKSDNVKNECSSEAERYGYEPESYDANCASSEQG